MGLRLQNIPKDQLDGIHSATMTVLREVGVKFPDNLALKTLEDVGAEVDYERQVARIPEDTVREMLKHAPRKVHLYARDPKHDVHMEDGKVRFKPSCIGTHIFDLETGKRRHALLQDVVKSVLIADYTENIQVMDILVAPCEVPQKVIDQYRFEAAFNNSTKHICTFIGPETGPDGARDIIEMAICIVGDREALAKRPIFSVAQEAVSPLQWNVKGLQAMMEFAKYKIPMVVSTLSAGGATAPVTLAGELVVINAEILSGLTLVQALSPGCPVIYGSVAGSMDPRSGVFCLGSPERAILSTFVTGLARYYGLPCKVGGLNTDAKMPGAQAALEKAYTALPLILAGSNLIHGAGCIDAGKTFSLEQLFIDDEIAGVLYRIARGADIDEVTLAVDVIREVGIGGHFLGKRHTLEHVEREQWMPQIYKRSITPEELCTPEIIGRRDLLNIAREKIKEITTQPKSEPLEKDVQRRIRKIVSEAEKRVIKEGSTPLI